MLAGRYRVERQLGEGGGAAVFRAEDAKHLRPVAVKVLHPEIAATAGPARFLREIETAARLNHPHILPLHDSGEAEGFLYYVMPYVEGESLRERLERERQLPLEEAARIAGEVGESLEYAHRQGVVHRDIKPENILISQGLALVADFGIAKLLEGGPRQLTSTSAVLGTPSYMSPEQLSGGGERIDGRADIYGLGCVLYEMLAGQPPFTGATAESVAYQHLSVKPRPVTALRPAVPEPVARVIDHALEKAPADRPQSAAAFVRELREATSPEATTKPRVRPVAVAASAGAAALLVPTAAPLWWTQAHRSGAAPQQSIAVLPLRDLSADPGQGYFADGMTDELITALAKISSLTVIASSAVLTYRNTEKPPARIARELGVRLLLEGSVARDPERVRIAARLIEASSGRNLWAETYDRGMRDVLSIPSDVALAVARQIQIRLTPGEKFTLSAAREVDPQAHDLYLRARFSLDPSTREGAQKSIQLLKQALELDPGYALAYAGLAETHYFLSNWFLPPSEAMPLARSYAAKAIALDSTLAEGHTVLGLVDVFYEWRSVEGLRKLRRAVEMNPGSAMAREWYAYALIHVGRFDEARAEFVRARALDPVSKQLQWFSIWPWFYQRRTPGRSRSSTSSASKIPPFGARTPCWERARSLRATSPGRSKPSRRRGGWGATRGSRPPSGGCTPRWVAWAKPAGSSASCGQPPTRRTSSPTPLPRSMLRWATGTEPSISWNRPTGSGLQRCCGGSASRTAPSSPRVNGSRSAVGMGAEGFGDKGPQPGCRENLVAPLHVLVPGDDTKFLFKDLFPEGAARQDGLQFAEVLGDTAALHAGAGAPRGAFVKPLVMLPWGLMQLRSVG